MKQLNDLLTGNIDPVLQATTVLGRLWRLYLYQSGLSAAIWQARLNKHLQAVSSTGKEKSMSDYKGNVIKALTGSSLPWNRYCTGMGIVAPDGFTFTFRMKMGKDVFEKSNTIKYSHKEDRGKLLKQIWVSIVDQYPDKSKQWKKLVAEYSKKGNDSKQKKHNSLGNNLKDALSKDSISWRIFFTCVMIIDPDGIELSVTALDITSILKVK